MIAYLCGKIKNKGNGYLIILVNNLGYKVFVNSELFSSTEKNKELELYIYQHITEQSNTLFGMKDMDELDFFELLIGVSGIGPKTALNVLSAAPIAELKDSIANDDPSLLNKVSGIGKKTAERVVLELKSKIGQLPDSGRKIDGIFAGSSDEIDALVSLGYTIGEAREALKGVDKSIKNSEERIKSALKNIGR